MGLVGDTSKQHCLTFDFRSAQYRQGRSKLFQFDRDSQDSIPSDTLTYQRVHGTLVKG